MTQAAMSRSAVTLALQRIPKDKAPSVTCSLIGHSKVQTYCFGYFNCARCGYQLGDALASVYPEAKTAVVIDHNCAECRKNAAALTWRDLYRLPTKARNYVRNLLKQADAKKES